MTISFICIFENFDCRQLLNTNVVGGITGNIEFNEEGDRIESLYEIVNMQQGQLKVVGTYRSNTVSFGFQGIFILERKYRNGSTFKCFHPTQTIKI